MRAALDPNGAGAYWAGRFGFGLRSHSFIFFVLCLLALRAKG